MEKVYYDHSSMALVLTNNKVLTISTVNGKLVLPKGHPEGDESDLEAIIRECYEETGIRLSKDEFVKELEPFEYQFTMEQTSYPHEDFAERFNDASKVIKSITTSLFVLKREPRPKQKKENWIELVSWMSVDDFLEKCSYDNTKKLLIQAIKIKKELGK